MNSKRLACISGLIIFLTLPVLAQQQPDFNLELVGQRNDYPTELYSDIWGYVDGNGTEYGIIGTRRGTAIYNLSDPANPALTQYIPGASSIWRDMKTHEEYIYVIADQGTDGLLVINMEEAPDTVTWSFYKPLLNINGVQRQLTDCHNVYIDENGYLYLSGCSLSDGVLIFDLNANIEEPPYLGRTPTNYSHDVFVRGDTLWTSDFNDGVFSVVDVSNKQAPMLLATQPTGFQATHNAWLSDDGNYFFTTDERPNAFVEAYDVSDLDNIELLDQYRPIVTEGRGVYPHNTFYYEGFLVTSYYTDGVKIIDANRPQNLVEVGSYDTYQGPDGGTEGNWGVYPYLPSGLLLASDIQSGLYVFDPTYQQAAYLEGRVRSARDSSLLSDVAITILSDQPNQALTDRTGQFRTGQEQAGTFRVAINRLGYVPDTVSVNLTNGEVTTLNVALRTSSVYRVQIQAVMTDEGQSPVPGATFLLEGEDVTYELEADEQGLASSSDILDGTYQVTAGAWGFREADLGSLLIDGDQDLTAVLDSGYQDFFNLDLGWQTSGTATSGNWVRDIPIGTDFGTGFINPGFDDPNDQGSRCYMTGNGGQDAGFDDIDNGFVLLESPPMDLSNYLDPRFSFALWFVNDGGGSMLDDSLRVSLTDGLNEVGLITLTESENTWRYVDSLPVSDLGLDLNRPLTLRVQASDLPPNGHLAEAAFDAFSVSDAGVTTSVSPSRLLAADIQVWPNPSTGAFRVQIDAPSVSGTMSMQVYNARGQLVEQRTVSNIHESLRVGESYQPGLYTLIVRDARSNTFGAVRMVKQ